MCVISSSPCHPNPLSLTPIHSQAWRQHLWNPVPVCIPLSSPPVLLFPPICSHLITMASSSQLSCSSLAPAVHPQPADLAIQKAKRPLNCLNWIMFLLCFCTSRAGVVLKIKSKSYSRHCSKHLGPLSSPCYSCTIFAVHSLSATLASFLSSACWSSPTQGSVSRFLFLRPSHDLWQW